MVSTDLWQNKEKVNQLILSWVDFGFNRVMVSIPSSHIPIREHVGFSPSYFFLWEGDKIGDDRPSEREEDVRGVLVTGLMLSGSALCLCALGYACRSMMLVEFNLCW